MKISRNEPLAKHTTFKIGGPADYFCEAKTVDDLARVISLAKNKQLNYFLLGNGSNLLVADRGFKGLVIKCKISFIKVLKADPKQIKVEVGSGTQLNELIVFLLKKGYVGLHHFSYIPATVGGAVYINAHYQKHFIADYFVSGIVLGKDGKIVKRTKDYFAFAYDYSYLTARREVLLSAVFQCPSGSLSLARKEREKILKTRKKYPALSAGCVWQNLTTDQQKKAGLDQASAGYLIDQVLNLKGYGLGRVRISCAHAAFIENLGGAKAAEVLQLIKLVRKKAREKTKIDLRPEIELVGFNNEELKAAGV